MNQKSIVLIIGKPGTYNISGRVGSGSHNNTPVYKTRWRKHVVTEIGSDFVVTLCGKLYAIKDCYAATENHKNALCLHCMHHIIPNPSYIENGRKARQIQLERKRNAVSV